MKRREILGFAAGALAFSVAGGRSALAQQYPNSLQFNQGLAMQGSAADPTSPDNVVTEPASIVRQWQLSDSETDMALSRSRSETLWKCLTDSEDHSALSPANLITCPTFRPPPRRTWHSRQVSR